MWSDRSGRRVADGGRKAPLRCGVGSSTPLPASWRFAEAGLAPTRRLRAIASSATPWNDSRGRNEQACKAHRSDRRAWLRSEIAADGKRCAAPVAGRLSPPGSAWAGAAGAARAAPPASAPPNRRGSALCDAPFSLPGRLVRCSYDGVQPARHDGASSTCDKAGTRRCHARPWSDATRPQSHPKPPSRCVGARRPSGHLAMLLLPFAFASQPSSRGAWRWRSCCELNAARCPSSDIRRARVPGRQQTLLVPCLSVSPVPGRLPIRRACAVAE